MAPTSRTEIEVLMKMRAEGAQSLDLFSGGLTKVGREGANAARGTDQVQAATKRLEPSAIAAGTALGLLADRAARSLVSGFTSSIQSANKMESALTGLDSVAKGMGQGLDATRQAAISLSSDGLMSVTEAATALKNLLATGYGLQESIQILNAHKDAAAFNRQGMLGFGESVVRVTDGLKFNNSMLTDSTGLGRNLSQAMKEAGMSESAFGNAVNDAAARAAYKNSVLKDAAIFHGNAAKYADSNAGALIQLGAASERASAALGQGLQPVVGAFASVAGPLLGVVEKYPGVFIAAAAAVSAMIAPTVALRAASMLGLDSFVGLGKGVANTLSIFKGVSTLSDFRAGLSLVSEGAVNAIKNLGPAGLAGAIMASVTAMGLLINHIRSWREETAKKEAESRKEIVTEREIANAIADGNKSRAAYLIQLRDIQLEQQKATAAAAEKEAAEKKTAAAAAEAAEAQRRALTFQSVATEMQAKIRKEIDDTGLTLGQLTTNLRTNEEAFKAWAERKKLSAETVKFLEAELKKQTEAQKKSTEAASKAAEAIEKQRDALESIGIVTRDKVRTTLAEFAELERRATAEGVPLNAVLIALIPKLTELAAQAKNSGVGVDETTAALNRATAAANDALRTLPTIASSGVFTFGGINTELGKTHGLMTRAQLDAQILAQSQRQLGIVSRAELQQTATRSIAAYNEILRSGQFTPEQIKIAFKRMKEDVAAANGEIPTQWESAIKPAILKSVDGIVSGVSSGFSQMLVGATGFKEGFVSIWKSIQSAIANILDSILNSFLNAFLKGMLGAMTGQQGAFSTAFSGLFSGAASTATTSAAASAASAGASGAAGSGSAAAGAGIGAGATAAIALGGVAAAGAYLQYLNVRNRNRRQAVIDEKLGQLDGLGMQDSSLAILGARGRAAAFAGGSMNDQLLKLLDELIAKGKSLKGELDKGADGLAEDMAKAKEEIDAATRLVAEGLSARMSALNSELATLHQSIANEAPEEVMGSIEAAARTRIAELEREKDAIQQQMTELTAELTTAFSKTAVDMVHTISKEFEGLKFKIPVEFEYEAPEGGGSTQPVPGNGRKPGGAAKGIYSDYPTLAIFGEGGEPELGGPRSFFADVLKSLGVGGKNGGGMGGGDTINVSLNVQSWNAADLRRFMLGREGDEFLSALTEKIRKSKASGLRLSDAMGTV